MIFLILPPLVEGGNEEYMINKLSTEIKDDFMFVGDADLEKRSSFGFYNFNTWMPKCNLDKTFYEILKDGDTVLFCDFWNPSVTNLYFHIKFTNLNVKLIGWLHGAGFVDGDVVNNFIPEKVLSLVERSWLEMYDQILCASKFFSKNIPQEYKNKLFYVGEPFTTDDYIGYRKTINKRYDVVFPFRLDSDKIDSNFLDKFIDLCKDLRILIASPTKVEKDFSMYPHVTIHEGLSGDAHLQDLADSKIVLSTAIQEGWGYAVMKAVTVGCVPVLPNRAVYPELYDEKYLYDSFEDAVNKVYDFLEVYPKDVILTRSYDFKNFSFNNGVMTHGHK
jgi:hypothetical protein